MGWWVIAGGIGVASWPLIGGLLARLESGEAPEEGASSAKLTDYTDMLAESIAYCSQLCRWGVETEITKFYSNFAYRVIHGS